MMLMLLVIGSHFEYQVPRGLYCEFSEYKFGFSRRGWYDWLVVSAMNTGLENDNTENVHSL